MVPALRADQDDDLQQARIPGALAPVRARLPRRRHAQRAEARRALRRGRLPDHDPVQAGRDGDHAPAGRRRRRTLREDSRRRARRRASRQRHPCGRAQRRRRDVQRLEAARVLLVEHRQRPRAAGRPGAGDVPRAGKSLPRRAAGRMRPLLLRLPRRRCRRLGAREAGARRPRARRCAPQAAGHAAVTCRPVGERRQPAVRTQGHDRPPVERRHAGAHTAHRRMARRHRPARRRCQAAVGVGGIAARARARAARQARRTRCTAATRTARRSTPGCRACGRHYTRGLPAPGRDQCGRESVLGSGSRGRGQYAADGRTRQVEIAVLLHARPRRPRREGGPQAGSGGLARARVRRRARDRPLASSGATTTSWACSR